MKSSLMLLIAAALAAQTPKPLPPPGVPIPDAVRATLTAQLRELNATLAPLSQHPLLPDVLIFREAARYALDYNEFFKPEEGAKAVRLVEEGLLRARQLASGQSPWTTATGLVVRGYRSEIDGSVQPYGLVIPPGGARRLDLWFHGRSDTLNEINFLTERMTRPGEFTPPDAIMLHLYGRYCNATKFAGEVDVLEALAHVRRHYSIDEDRIFARGFSMGGASTWHIAAHHAHLFAAAAPGAGFAETREYQDLAAKGDVRPWYEQKLWRWYDATEYAANFFNLPLVAYSGEKDRQIQAAQIMQRYLAQEGLELAHVIGPNTEHKYHPEAKPEIEKRLAGIARAGRNPYPDQIRFTTYTLRYNRMRWIVVDGLDQHWERARVNAQILDSGDIQIEASNVSSLTIDFAAGGWRYALDRPATVRINGQRAASVTPKTDRGLRASFVRRGSSWQLGADDAPLRKRHGLQGPIDDAFLASFLFVLPSGPMSEWVKAESERAIRRWRELFRGEARVKKDSEVTGEDIARSHLVLWGEPGTNTLMAKVLPGLPLEWSAGKVKLGQEECTNCMPVLIYPNPLNRARYVVLNSGPTLREDSNGTNSLQTPRLPDWALVGLDEKPGPARPGRIAAAGFFDEFWRPAATTPR